MSAKQDSLIAINRIFSPFPFTFNNFSLKLMSLIFKLINSLTLNPHEYNKLNIALSRSPSFPGFPSLFRNGKSDRCQESSNL